MSLVIYILEVILLTGLAVLLHKVWEIKSNLSDIERDLFSLPRRKGRKPQYQFRRSHR